MVREAVTAGTLADLPPREAAALFIARRADGLSGDEARLLAGWLAKGELNRAAYENAERAWSGLSSMEGEDIFAAMRVHALAARPAIRAAWLRPAAAAAAVLLVAAAALVFQPDLNLSRREIRQPLEQPIAVTYESQRGQVRQLQLPDGSSMTLDADSVAVGRFSTAGRSVQLRRGRALFAIFPDHSRPFSVAAAGRTIRAVGTRFDVNVVSRGVTVTLLEGRVAIESNSTAPPIGLAPGQQFIERAGVVTIRSIGAAVENETLWRDGHVHFEDQPLSEAAEVMNRYSRSRIVTNDPTIAALRISGQFRAADGPRFAATLAEKYGLQLRVAGDRIELTRSND